MLDVLKLFARVAQREDQRGPLPGRTRAQLRLRDAGSDQRSGQPIPRRRSQRWRHRQRWKARKNSEQDDSRKKKQEEGRRRRQKKREPSVEAEAAGGSTNWCRPAKRAKWRPRSPPAGPTATSRSTTRPGCPPAPSSSKATLREDRRPLRLRHQGRRRRTAHEAYRMVLVLRRVRRHPLLRRAGDPRLGRPADPRRPEPKPRRSTAASTRSSPTAAGSR